MKKLLKLLLLNLKKVTMVISIIVFLMAWFFFPLYEFALSGNGIWLILYIPIIAITMTVRQYFFTKD